MFQKGRIQESTFFHLLKLPRRVQIKSTGNSREQAHLGRLRLGNDPGFEIWGNLKILVLHFVRLRR